MPASGWWIMIRAFGSSEYRFAFGTGGQQNRTHRRGLTHAVGRHVAGLTNCMVS